MTLASRSIPFELPDSRVATVPPERRGMLRDGVRRMIASGPSPRIEHGLFTELVDRLHPGDALVINVSATVPASLPATASDGTRLRLHVATPATGGLWSAEIRTPEFGGATSPGPDLEPQTLSLPGGARADLLARSPRSPRLWIVAIAGPDDLLDYLRLHGEPVRYTPGPAWPISEYQTVFATEPGSAEMPSAARPFTTALVTRLISRGVTVLPVLLHTGLSSYEDHEAPGEECYRVPLSTAVVANELRHGGGRVIAVGTTVVRALETVVDSNGDLHPGRGLTDLVVTPERGVRAVDGLITGWHEPRSSHLLLLEAMAGRENLQEIYEAGLGEGYLWHEFGDSLLILPAR